MLLAHQTQPRSPNAMIRDAAVKVAEAIDALSENGFTVVKVELDMPARPTIRIQTCAHCHRLISNGDAVYYSYGQQDHFGPYREGQFQLGGCRVVWLEMGH
ncbi:hypothetical protein [Paludibacterium yongneupense]|uniref:hypothetical protein n=1 Tax=Paludibacterium yongneupense TaxID=400061 RepID=UPI000566ECA2|nr:hypothetical protein [Paludibacterium yongneupense]